MVLLDIWTSYTKYLFRPFAEISFKKKQFRIIPKPSGSQISAVA